MNLQTAEKIRKAFCLQNPVAEIQPLGNGGIHETCRIQLADGKKYIFQQMNTHVFSSPETVMQNIQTVTEYLKRNFPEMVTLHFYQTADKQFLFQNWRVMDYIPGDSFRTLQSPIQIQQAGTAFGQFQHRVSNLDSAKLQTVIPHFHDTAYYYEKLLCLEHHAPVLQWQEQACFVQNTYKNRNIPLTVTHYDMKCSNLLFDRNTGKPCAVIDLDTVMPGFAVYDFGDAVRSLCGNGLDLQIFQAFATGWLSETNYSESEQNLLIPAIFSVTAELAVRYYTDYLQGNLYFKTAYPEQNLVKARKQIQLAEQFLHYQPEMQAILERINTHGTAYHANRTAE